MKNKQSQEPLKNHAHEHGHAHEQGGNHEQVHEHGRGGGGELKREHRHVHESKKTVANRLSRAAGHLDKVRRMVENDADCPDILIQLSAVVSALENTGKIILQDHLRHCVVDAAKSGDQNAIDEICSAIDKLIK